MIAHTERSRSVDSDAVKSTATIVPTALAIGSQALVLLINRSLQFIIACNFAMTCSIDVSKDSTCLTKNRSYGFGVKIPTLMTQLSITCTERNRIINYQLSIIINPRPPSRPYRHRRLHREFVNSAHQPQQPSHLAQLFHNRRTHPNKNHPRSLQYPPKS